MALNADRIGAVYPSYTYEVSREKIREFGRAIGEIDPRLNGEADDTIAPPTFAACFTVIHGAQAALSDPVLGAHTSLVHGSQTFELGDRPLRPGDVLVCTPRIADVSARAGNDLLTIEVECRRHEDDSLAVRATTMLVLLGSEGGA